MNNNISKQIETIKSKYNLQYNPEKKVFQGLLEVDEDDFYNVEINISRFPFAFPTVKELDGRIPKKIDRHIYADGNCCLTTGAKEDLLLKTRIKSLNDFFQLMLIPYFVNNSYYEIHKKYVEGEYSHGINGIIESYQEILNIEDLLLLIQVLEWRIAGKKFDRNAPCFCNSGKKFKKCHQKNYEALNLIDEEILINDLKRL